ncbi:MAG: tRNA dihydrouridine(20/20a) synthase DusA [Betaproteobacteria bacterium]|nr:tRNA dihydrouridine(20/20a) synthase DusA [Betaproteobacteria bacterium]
MLATAPSSHRFCVAPMMDLTDRHARYLLRLISRRARLYTEMITTGALLHGDARRFLQFDDAEHPVAIQLGGSDPRALSECARLAAQWGYDEVNLNVGCPSDRVQNGRFGACLMAEPGLVADCVESMVTASSVPVTVKTRIGIDRDDTTDRLYALVERVRRAGCRTVIVHARNAWLQGLSPKENREIPPLRYPVVHALKQDFPDLLVVVNGGIDSVPDACGHLARVDGVMVGREAYYNPWMLSTVDAEVYGEPGGNRTRGTVAAAFAEYVEREMTTGTPLTAMTKHLLGLFQGQPGARAWRRTLSEEARMPGTGPEVIDRALARVSPLGEATAAAAA